MNIEEARNEVKESESRTFKIKSLVDRHDAASKVLWLLTEVKKAGRLDLVGKSGRIGEETPLFTISINRVGGCVAVPDLIKSLAKKTINEIEEELATY